jgi:7-carboxy-7-deazaguanine synthase
VITGGEPYLQKNVVDLIEKLVREDRWVTVETNGLRYRPTPAQFISLSPKLRSSHAGEPREYLPPNIPALRSFMQAPDYQFKFVMHEPDDLTEIETLQKALLIPPEKVYLMPQGVTRQQLQQRGQWIVPICCDHGYRYTPRLQVELWGNQRGV